MSQSSTSSVVAVDALLVRDVDGQYRPARAEEVLSRRGACWPHRVRRGATMSSPQAVKDHLRLEIGVLEHEVFCVLFLDAQHRIIALKQMFRGTVTQTSVYPREVVKEALSVNAAAVILAHNHPSGSVEPSRADEFLTQTLKTALALVDVRVLDHLVVAGARRVFVCRARDPGRPPSPAWQFPLDRHGRSARRRGGGRRTGVLALAGCALQRGHHQYGSGG
jgi:DNA repair protein RadC